MILLNVPSDKGQRSKKKKASISIACGICINNVGVQEMGLIHSCSMGRLSSTPAVLLSQLGFSKSAGLSPFGLAIFFLTSLNGIFAQISIPSVDLEITTIVVQISAPTTWFAPILIFRARFTLAHLAAIIVMFNGYDILGRYIPTFTVQVLRTNSKMVFGSSSPCSVRFPPALRSCTKKKPTTR